MKRQDLQKTKKTQLECDILQKHFLFKWHSCSHLQYTVVVVIVVLSLLLF